MRVSFFTNLFLLCSLVVFLLTLFLSINRYIEFEKIQPLDDEYGFRFNQSTFAREKADVHDEYLRKRIHALNKTNPTMLDRFTFSNPPESICSKLNDTDHTMIIVVLSRALNFDYRLAIRATWGRNRKLRTSDIYIQTIFFVGIDDDLQSAIQDEQRIFNDVIEIGIPENYPFVAHKELATLLWTRLYCSLVRFVFRADDDILLDTYLLLDYLDNHINFDLNDGLYGWFRFNNTVHRADKWAVTKLEYHSSIYPPYTFGIGYLFSNQSCQQLINAANHSDHQIIRIGDAYITGILRESAGVSFYDFKNLEFAYTFYDEIPCEKYFENNMKLLICMSKLHVGNRNDSYEFYNVWDVIEDRYE